MWISPGTKTDAYELDELYWFIERKGKRETRENIYIMTMISRNPRQIVEFAVDKSITTNVLQGIADSAPAAGKYYTDGCLTYCDVIFSGKHIRNVHDKKDTHNIESVNADLRQGLSRQLCKWNNPPSLGNT